MKQNISLVLIQRKSIPIIVLSVVSITSFTTLAIPSLESTNTFNLLLIIGLLSIILVIFYIIQPLIIYQLNKNNIKEETIIFEKIKPIYSIQKGSNLVKVNGLILYCIYNNRFAKFVYASEKTFYKDRYKVKNTKYKLPLELKVKFIDKSYLIINNGKLKGILRKDIEEL